CAPAAAAFDSYVAGEWQRDIESASCAMSLSREGTLCHRRLRLRTVSTSGVECVGIGIFSTPDDHFTAGPHGCVKESGRGRVRCAGGCPSISAGIISAAGIENAGEVKSAPYNHFATSPN